MIEKSEHQESQLTVAREMIKQLEKEVDGVRAYGVEVTDGQPTIGTAVDLAIRNERLRIGLISATVGGTINEPSSEVVKKAGQKGKLMIAELLAKEAMKDTSAFSAFQATDNLIASVRKQGGGLDTVEDMLELIVAQAAENQQETAK